MIYKREEYVQEAPDDQKFPVKQVDVISPIDGSPARYVGHVSLGLQTGMGVQQIPLSFPIEAAGIEEAFSKFEESAQPRIEEARKGIQEEIQRMRQEQAGRIVRPDEVGLGGAGGGIVDLKNIRKP